MISFTKELLPFAKTNSFDKLILDYLNKDAFLRKFYAFEDDIEGIKERIDSYENRYIDRNLLKTVIIGQYRSSGIEVTKNVAKNLELLTDSKTFTVTAGHQLNIFGGPLYVIYKLIATIKLSEELKKKFPENNFVPVYWMATEDHDIEEISSVSLFGKTFKWNSTWKGPAGNMPLSGLQDVFNELKNVFGSSAHTEELSSIITSSYFKSTNLADATRKWINALLGTYGLIILDGNDSSLKKQFTNVFKDEITNQSSSSILNSTTTELGKKYHPQVKPREINLFYMGENFRERIIKENDIYKILNTNIIFSRDEILKEIDANPQKFSPNVVMRPVYQECILPNISFVGGPTEISYWLELKGLFEHHQVPMPVLIHRSSALIIEKNISNKLQKLSISNSEVFQTVDDLIKNYIHKTDHKHPEFQIASATITGEFAKLKNAVSLVDVTLKAAVEAESQKVTTSLHSLEEKILRSLKKKNETEVNQIRKIKEKLFPNNKLQERHDSFLQYYLNWGSEFVEILMENFNPLEKEFIILEEIQ